MAVRKYGHADQSFSMHCSGGTPTARTFNTVYPVLFALQSPLS